MNDLDINTLITCGVLLAGATAGFATLRTQVKSLDKKIDDLTKNHLRHLQSSYMAMQKDLTEVQKDVIFIKAKLNGDNYGKK